MSNVHLFTDYISLFALTSRKLRAKMVDQN